jgi:hypothetical protein
MNKNKLREKIRNLKALALDKSNPHEAELARERVLELEALLSATAARGIFEKIPGSGIWWIRYG